MSTFTSRLMSGLATAVLAVGLASAQGMPGLGGPQPSPAPAPAGTVQVQILNNPTKGFQIGYPVGWEVVAGSAEVDYGFMSPDQLSFCVVVSADIPEIAGTPDDQVRAAMSAPQGEQFWKNVYFSQFQNVNFLHTGAVANHPGGWPLQTVVATADVELGGSPVNLIFAGILTLKSGTMFRTICYTPTANFEQSKAQFFAVFESFKITK